MDFNFIFFFIAGTRFVVSSTDRPAVPMRCEQCGTYAPFAVKKGRQFLTVFFIPLIPLGGAKLLAECPTCKTRYGID